VRRREAVDEALVVSLVRQVRQTHPRAGVRKLMFYLEGAFRKADVRMGRDRLFNLLRSNGMLVRRRGPATPRTTRFDSCLPVAWNLVRDLEPEGPDQVWVADITYIRTEEGFLYLSLITDMFSRKIVGFDVGDSLETQGCLEALRMAQATLKRGRAPIHHSDRGCQYGSHVYRRALSERGMACSMTEELHCYENALAERVNGILKQEYFLDLGFKTKAAAIAAVKQAVYTYNNLRIHEALGFRTPASVHVEAA